MASDYIFYCDETGNSGSRFYFPDQPIYAEGGWIVPEHERSALMSRIAAMEAEAGYTPKTKGTSLKKSPTGRAYMRKVCEECAKHAIPFIYLVEKRYAVCAKAVETYFDSQYNPSVPHQEGWDPEKRQVRAQMFYDGPEQLIAEFAEAFRCNNAAEIKNVGLKWKEYFQSSGLSKEADELAAVLPEIEKNISAEFEVLKGPDALRGFDSLNMPALAQVFQTVEQNVPPCDILHDECASFEEVYKYIFQIGVNARPGVIQLKDGRKHVTGFRNIKSINFGNSETEPILRAADYLVACCVEFARTAFEQRTMSSDLSEAAHPAIGAIVVWAISGPHGLDPMPKLGELFASEKWVARCSGQMLQYMQKTMREKTL